MSRVRLFTSESVTEGHPDKACDQVSDAILDAYLAQDPSARVGCETTLKTSPNLGSCCFLSGEITSSATLDPTVIARQVLTDIGYTTVDADFDPSQARYVNWLSQQSRDISVGVTEGQGLHHQAGAGDQGMMFGFACDETPECMPASLAWAHRLTAQLTDARRRGRLPWLHPDGKSQVTLEYVDGRISRIVAVVVSCHHQDGVRHSDIVEAITQQVIHPVLPNELMTARPVLHINPTGNFVIGGPLGDAGLTGRKIIVDTYGGHGSHGGGAFSGKDPTKVDRSAAYMARSIAKHIVAAQLARRCLVQLAYAIGVADPVSVLVDTFGTACVDEERLSQAVREVFPLTPAGIIAHFDLRRPIYRQTACNGHFGHGNFPWEELRFVADLRTAVKV